jgi:F-type H+-transporting ATPase subunit gamma
MSQSFEHAKSRLDNIRTIEPLLSALRTMSMGSWQMANRKIANLIKYEEDLDQILIEILPKFAPKPAKIPGTDESELRGNDTIYLIIGSERGLCGKFNTSLAEKSLEAIEDDPADSYQIWVMGSRLRLEFERKGIPIGWRKELPASGLITYHETYTLTQTWIEEFESYSFNRLVVFFNQLIQGSQNQITQRTLLPYEFDRHPAPSQAGESRWPPTIIETDPKGIYYQTIQHFIAASLYKPLLMSAAAEHSARYHLLQEASENAEEIIEELIRIINVERKRKITQQMQELAVSSGLLEI